jgi:hypothetical protein
MAQTDARPGFRLPWNSERSTTDQTDADETTQPDGAESVTNWPTGELSVVPDATVATGSEPETETVTAAESTPDVADAPTPSSAPRRPNKFMADLSKAMQAAAEEARTRTLGQFEADAKGHIDTIQGRLTTETADLRRKADDDVAAVREWSKQEIARIREETEGRISARKGQLESEIALHAAQIDREVEVVKARVAEFESEMSTFFERLLAEDDPTRIATMAERLPEPPSFETVTEAAATMIATTDDTTDEPETTSEIAADTTVTTEPEGETVAAEASTFDQAVPEGFEIDREAAFAAVQAAAEAAASAEVATDAANRAETVAEIMIGTHADDSDTDRAAAPDFDAAEAEAAASVEGEGEVIPEIGDDDLAARLAGLVPGKASGKTHSTDSASTQVVVVGLVSVASIASFKRHLGRVSGVQSVGVSSGPDGEFVFAVQHAADVALRDALPSLPSFQARVTGSTDGVLNVTAHDPESDN